jgi:uncharacterized protein YecT (DUF1311 family)
VKLRHDPVRGLWAFLVISVVAHFATAQMARDQLEPLLYYARGNNVQLVYQKTAEDHGMVDIYEFRENGDYATLGRQVVTRNGSLVAEKSSDDRDNVSLNISPWPSTSQIQVTAADPGRRLDASGEYHPVDKQTMMKTEAERFADADQQLNSVYRQVIARLHPANIGALRQFQREWANNRDDSAETLVHFNYGELESGDKQIQFDLARTLDTLDRIKLLRDFPAAMAASGVTGTYSTNWHRTLRIDEHNGEVAFGISALNPRNGSTGDLVGRAKLRGNKMKWVDAKDSPPDLRTGRLAEVTITFKANKLATVDSKNDGSYHGVGVIFSGDYLRTSATRPKIGDSQ